MHWKPVTLLLIRIFKVEKIVQPFSRPFIMADSQKETA